MFYKKKSLAAINNGFRTYMYSKAITLTLFTMLAGWGRAVKMGKKTPLSNFSTLLSTNVRISPKFNQDHPSKKVFVLVKS